MLGACCTAGRNTQRNAGVAGAHRKALLWEAEGCEWHLVVTCLLWPQRGTLGYMAPELMGYKHDDDESHNRHPVTMAVDIYSFGLLLWAIITGEKPRMHDKSLRKPRSALSQALQILGLAMCWGLCVMRHGQGGHCPSFLEDLYPSFGLLLWAKAIAQAQVSRTSSHPTCETAAFLAQE